MEDEVVIPPSKAIPSGWKGPFKEITSFELWGSSVTTTCARCNVAGGIYTIMAGGCRFDRCRNCMGELWNLRVKYGLEW